MEIDEMTTKELDRLIDWLKDNGHTAALLIGRIATVKSAKSTDYRTHAAETVYSD